MKKLLFVLLCACTLNAVAKPSNQDTLSQLFEPIFLIGYQIEREQQAPNGTSDRDECLLVTAHKIITPVALNKTMETLNKKRLGKKMDVITQFLAKDSERTEYVKNRAELDALMQANKSSEALGMWMKYIVNISGRMPKTAENTLWSIFDVVGDLDVEKMVLENQTELLKEINTNPACKTYWEQK